MYLHPLEGTPLAGFRGFTRVGFLLGAWAVLFKTLYVATAANSRLTADFLDLVGIWRPRARARERVVKLFCVIYPVLALGLYYAFREPQALIKAGGIAQALMLPLICRGGDLPPPPRCRPPGRPVILSACCSPGWRSWRSLPWPSTAPSTSSRASFWARFGP